MKLKEKSEMLEKLEEMIWTAATTALLRPEQLVKLLNDHSQDNDILRQEI